MGTVVAGLAAFVGLTAQNSPFIHVDQFGYRTHAYKVAVLSDPQSGFNESDAYTPPDTLELKSLPWEITVARTTPQAWNAGATHDQSGDRGWWADFTSLATPGHYFLYDPVNDQRSPSFFIGEDPYLGTLKAAGRMFFYNRCGPAKPETFTGPGWSDAASFLQDTVCRALAAPDDPDMWRDLSGGWFDAGDYNKYVTFAHSPVHDLLRAWEENPHAFGDDWNIPESGNGRADILDELLVELDWLYKMTDPLGGCLIKMGSIQWDHNISAPPSANVDPRYYGPRCTASSIAAAGMLAHAALVFRDFPEWADRAQMWHDRAIACFHWSAPDILAGEADTECDDGTIKAGDADWDAETQFEAAVTAAVYLHDLTGLPYYGEFVRQHAPATRPMASGWWDCYQIPLTDALLRYSTTAGADSLTGASIRQSLETASFDNWGQFFGYTEQDLYRAWMPEWSYHWGSNLPKANYALLNLLLDRYGVAPWDSLAFRYKAEEQLHYFHGVNPLGLVYLSNMYDQGVARSVHEIYHTWFADGSPWDHALQSPYGPPPGFLSGGPNMYFTQTALSPPANQPPQKAYLDFNTGWPDNSWEVSEPSISYQAAYVRLLAHFVSREAPSGTGSVSPAKETVHLYPNPVGLDRRVRRVQASAHAGTVLDAKGRQVGIWPSRDADWEVNDLPAGWYVVVWDDGIGRFVVR